jgi:UPF0042 nucleotide-binding protein
LNTRPDNLNLIIVSGTSGSGKTKALQVLEDLGYYCIDNLPSSLIPSLINTAGSHSKPEFARYAISIDARNRDHIEHLDQVLASLSQIQSRPKLIFLDADDKTLLKRYSESRRKHPLSDNQTSLFEAIKLERQLLEPLSESASHHINTTSKTPHELRSLVTNIATDSSNTDLVLLISSFGFKYGNPADADFVFDVRCLPNPHWQSELQPLTGLDKPVADYLNEQPICIDSLIDIERFLKDWIPRFVSDDRNYLTIAIGCTGGKHRSVFVVDQLHQRLKTLDNIVVQARHRELSI